MKNYFGYLSIAVALSCLSLALLGAANQAVNPHPTSSEVAVDQAQKAEKAG